MVSQAKRSATFISSGLFLKRPSCSSRNNPEGQKLLARWEHKHGKAKALSILAHKLGRAAYFMLKNKEAFNQKKFLGLSF